MKKDPKISVIMPCYNCEKYVSQAIESVLNQTYKNLELICVDDCSTDDTVNIIRQYTENNKNIHLVKTTKNQGPGLLRAKGLNIAKGNWVLFCDADDWYEPDLFHHLSKIITENANINIIEFRYYVSQDKNHKKVADWLNRGENGIKDTKNEDIMLATALWNKCYNKKFLTENSLYETEKTNRTNCGEIVAHICSFLLAKKFYYLNFLGYNWIVNQNGLCHDTTKDEKFLQGVWLMLDDLKSELTRLNLYNKENYINYCATILNWHINEKFSYSNVYRKYYNKVRQFMKLNQKYLRKKYKHIIKTPYSLFCIKIFFKKRKNK